jgi:hypothetical protein
MVTVAGLVVPVRLPDQPLNKNPEFGEATTEIIWPRLYQATPEGVMFPAAAGLVEVVRLYWVVKLAVYVVVPEDAVTV